MEKRRDRRTIEKKSRREEFESEQKKGDGPYRKWPRLDHPRVVTTRLVVAVERCEANTREREREKTGGEGGEGGEKLVKKEGRSREEREGLYCHGNATRDRVTWTNWRGAGEVGARPAGQRTARNTDTTLLWDCKVAVATQNRYVRAFSVPRSPSETGHSDVRVRATERIGKPRQSVSRCA